ncbi:MAG: DUF4162 domain-containing protein, partial [Gemmatimonadota bacterium]
ALDRPQALQRSLEGTMLAIRGDRPRQMRDVLRESSGILSASLFGDSVHALLSAGTDREGALAPLGAAGLQVLDVEEVEASLEDVFIHLVHENDAAGDGTHV